jgi:colicin import membrane protein
VVVQDVSPENDSFAKLIGTSFLFHIGLLLFFSVKSLVFPTEMVVVREAIRVDIVGLPDKIDHKNEIQAIPSSDKDPSKHTNMPEKGDLPMAAKEAPKVDLKKAKVDQSRAIAKLNALSSIEKLAKEMKEVAVTGDSSARKEFKGNVLSPGESLVGLDALDHNTYFVSLKRQVQKYFVLPQWLAESTLRAQALVKIDERGYVVSRELIKSSGDAAFDAKVFEAIDAASPFPPPPPRLVNVIALNGLLFNFPD